MPRDCGVMRTRVSPHFYLSINFVVWNHSWIEANSSGIKGLPAQVLAEHVTAAVNFQEWELEF